MIISSAARYISFSFLAALLLCLCPALASARLSGEAALNYTSYSMSDNFKNRLSSHSFTQDYSLLYSKSGAVYNSRLGRYSVALGYNWSMLNSDTTANGVSADFNGNRGHFLYSGELLLDPKELPIRLTAYSRDLTRNSFSTANSAVANNIFLSNNGQLLGRPELFTGIDDGLHIESGATLVAGVKNGMTNGYNEILRHFPMIMLDYRDQINKDRRAFSPVDNRLSRLAFVSLNKKDNWFHYRYTTYKDNINSVNDYSERQFQIGTVDQNLERRWIDFSNWLQVSADLQLTKRINNNMSQDYEESDLNLFVQARRRSWEARSYNNFNRYRDNNGRLTYKTTMPLNVTGVLNPDVSWSTRVLYKDTHDNAGAHLESAMAGYRVETFKRSLFTLSQYFDLESSSSESSELLVLSGGLETTSSTRFSRKVSLGASYSIKNSVQKNSFTDSNFLEQKLSLRSSYAPTNQLRINLSQTFDYTSGQWQNFSSSVRDVNTTLPQYISPRTGTAGDAGSSGFHSVTSLSIAWNPAPRLNLGLMVSEDIFKQEKGEASNITNVTATFGYEAASVRVNNTLTYTDGSSQLNSQSSSLNNTATLQYRHNRNLDAKLLLAYSRYVTDSVESDSYNAEQRLDYIHYSRSGFSKKVFEINEMIAYSSAPEQANTWNSAPGSVNNISSNNTISSYYIAGATGRHVSRASLSLGFKYYPLRQLILSGGGRYQYESKFSNYSLMWYASAATNFRLFQASLDYYQGKRQSDGLMEKKFTANVKKTF